MTAWKDLERRICRALGGERAGPRGGHGSDCVGLPFAVEVKRSSRQGPPVLAAWVVQARRQGVDEGKPWVLVVAGHRDREPIAVVDFAWLTRLIERQGEYP